ncbi:MAG: NAD-dependent epimerase/dehydratase family protein [Micrococcales bacterium]|nr:NAD-dependent epimerase/dehydratase family protein [Microbacteriaceae bacterium]NBR22662.1 NAD-dependent epimerase/dehydratase family protein [Micrococcales bacterium]NBX94602.1 NAD-dependent epimerase/dehydratase family protein [Actinomycetota bacterium]NBR77666.1 NAD-dependent epimerase/dehydratase family protein [Microbacteriaceae bacterium]NBS60900.1 NAD-dependent epimerase/dehydratase family protein [Microbacteriaceae bacterium]
MVETHLVLGAGEVGSALARQLADSGKSVVLFTRSGRGPAHSLIKRIAADASSIEALLAAAPKAVAIYNCVNPPHYNKWATEWPPLAKAFTDYALATDAVLVTCSNLYGYGPTTKSLTEDLPLNGTWINSKVRAQMWLDAKKLNDEGLIRATEVRGSDYVSPGMQSRFGDRVVPVLKAGKAVQLLGATDQLHTFTSPVDVATLMRTIALDKRAWGKAWHVPSNEPKTQREVVQDIAKELGIRDVKVGSVPNAILSMMGLFNPVIKELNNGSYMFNAPFIMDDSAARKTFGLEPTPWDVLIKNLVAAYK